MKKLVNNRIAYRVRSIKMQDFLEERGLVPVGYEGEAALYEKSDKFYSLLEDYEIYKCFFNRR